jgi:hypothetical protein
MTALPSLTAMLVSAYSSAIGVNQQAFSKRRGFFPEFELWAFTPQTEVMILTRSGSIVTWGCPGWLARRGALCQRQAQRVKPAVHHQLNELECRFHLMLRNATSLASKG